MLLAIRHLSYLYRPVNPRWFLIAIDYAPERPPGLLTMANVSQQFSQQSQLHDSRLANNDQKAEQCRKRYKTLRTRKNHILL